MDRNVSLEEISDGKLYDGNDLVKADCKDCEGCSACCRGMGSSIILDPYDVYRLEAGLKVPFGQLLAERLELNVVDGIILPNLKMADSAQACSFLDRQGRCGIHPFRPGFCRLFPLGRLYENRSFRYFLQIHECSRENRTKVKVRKWIDTPDFKTYEKFVGDWHYFLKDLGDGVKENGTQECAKAVNMYVLNHFYVNPYELDNDFYPQFYERLKAAVIFAASQSIKIHVDE